MEETTVTVDIGLLAWHLIMERSRYQGSEFRQELIQAFAEIEKSLKDTHVLGQLRKELNLEA